jgi:hypothetical protein
MARGTEAQFDYLYRSLLDGLSRPRKNLRQDFVEISRTNLQLVDDILDRAQNLKSKKKYAEAEVYLDIASRILDNNRKLQNTVGEVLSEKD